MTKARSGLAIAAVISISALALAFRLLRRRAVVPSTGASNRPRGAQVQRAAPRTITFALVDDFGGRRSMEWRFKLTSKDIYLAPYLHFGPPQPGIFHASLHADGRCHWTYDTKYWNSLPAQQRGPKQPRKWKRPLTNAAMPSALAYAITFLPDPANVPPIGTGERFDLSAQAPTAGFAVELQLIFSQKPPGQFGVSGGRILDSHTLGSGETVYFVLLETHFDPRNISVANQVVVRHLGDGTLLPTTRMAAWIDPNDIAYLNTVLDVPAQITSGSGATDVCMLLVEPPK